MATNSEKYTSICGRVSLMRNSWALERFLADAARHHMDDQPGKLIALRLTEYYELLDRLNVLPGGLAVLSALPAAAVSEAARGSDKPPTAQTGTLATSAAHGEEGEGKGESISKDTAIEDAEDDQWTFPS